MRRLIVPIILFALTSPATAALHLLVNGAVPDSETYIMPSDTLSLGIYADPATGNPGGFFLCIDGPGTIDGHDMWCPPDHYCILTLVVPPIEPFPCYYYEFPITPIPEPLEGLLADNILFHCEGTGDVTLTLLNLDGEILDVVTIHQGPPPPPMELIMPEGGEYYRAGSLQTIRFIDNREPGASPNYQRLLSLDDGQNWMYWFGGPSPDCTNGQCSWQWYVPGMDSDNCMIRVLDANDPTASDTSDGPFTIYSGRLYVNAADGNDTNSGISPEKAFETIQKAIETANDGDTIIVTPGTYTEDINLLGKNVILTSTEPDNSNTVKSTTIEGTVTFRGTEDANCTLTGFNIKGPISGFDFSIDPTGKNHTHAAISHCIQEGFATGCGNLVYACNGVISNCIFANINYMCLRPSPVPQIVACHGLIENCTMANMYDGVEVSPGGTTTLKNCILYNSSWFVVSSDATLNISYSNAKRDRYTILGDGTVNWGPGNIDSDPCFADEGTWLAAGDYHLKSQAGRFDPNSESWLIDEVTSLCINAGDPATPINHEPFPNGGIINMGAYGGTPEASKSYFGTPPCKTIVAGDVNGDCIVDFKDISLTFYHWLENVGP